MSFLGIFFLKKGSTKTKCHLKERKGSTNLTSLPISIKYLDCFSSNSGIKLSLFYLFTLSLLCVCAYVWKKVRVCVCVWWLSSAKDVFFFCTFNWCDMAKRTTCIKSRQSWHPPSRPLFAPASNFFLLFFRVWSKKFTSNEIRQIPTMFCFYFEMYFNYYTVFHKFVQAKFVYGGSMRAICTVQNICSHRPLF